ncbi:hypothetical protein PINS_up001483 [Pythium insidiosum]|nr:hypothetical protein PINS_up001483 [Pythium insidiosum]
MRLTSVGVAATAAALGLFHANAVNAVKNCGECPAGKTCVLENVADPLQGGQSSLNIKVCNFDKARANDYKFEFSLRVPLACDPSMQAVPKATAIAAQDPCDANNCVVRVSLEKPLDSALLMKNGADPNALLAKLTSPAANVNPDAVQVAAPSTTEAAVVNDAAPDSKLDVCSREFSINALRLSRVKECNVAQVCIGKSTDTTCPTPLASNLLIDDVSCTNEACTGSVTLPDSTNIPCDVASGNTLLMNVRVGNSGASNAGKIATLAAAPKPTISDVDNLSVDSTTVKIKTDAACPQSKLTVTVGDLKINNFTTTSSEALVVLLDKPIPPSQRGKSLSITLAQCSAVSKAFDVKVAGADGQNESGDGSSNRSTGVITPNTGADATGQRSDVRTGLAGGLYIGIGVGVVALFGFVFECWYHKRRQPKPASELPSAARFGATAV